MKIHFSVLSVMTYAVWILLFIVGIADLFGQPSRLIMWFGGLGLLVIIYFAAKDVPEYLHFLLALIAL